jgi:hypothetical protein
MSFRLPQVCSTLAWASLLATLSTLSATMRAAQPVWAGGHGNDAASNGQNYNNNGGNVPTANDRVRHSGGTMFVDVPLTFGSLEFTGGIIEGANPLTLSDSTSDWTGGELSTATLNLSGLRITAGANAKTLNNGAKLNLSGTTAWGADNITTGGGSEFNNAGTFTTDFDGKIAHDGISARTTFNNNGTFTKSAGSTGATEIQTIFNNNSGASLNVNAGTLKLSGGGASTGTVNVSSTAQLQIVGNYSFSGGNLTGNGTIDIADALTTFSGTNGGGTNLKVSGGRAKFSGAHATNGTLTLTSGVIDGEAGSSANVGGFNWNTGDITTTTIVSSGAATISGAGNKKLIGGAQLTLNGTTTWDGSSIETGGGSKISNQNGGTFNVTGDGGILHSIDANRATFTNDGTFTKSGGSMEGTDIQVRFENNNILNAAAGKLRLSGGGTSTGNVSVSANATLQIDTADFNFNGGALTGSGSINLAGANTTFSGVTGNSNIKISGGTAKFTGSSSSTGALTLNSGVIDGASTTTATVAGLTWTAGEISTTNIVTSGGATIVAGDGNRRLSNGAKLTFAGNTTWDGSTITTGEASQITNAANVTFSVSGNGTIAHDGVGARSTFTNAGVFSQSGAATDSTEIQTKFVNTGAINASAGTLRLSGGGNSTGTVTIANNAKIEIGGSDFSFTSGTLSGNGTIEISSATASFGGTSGSANLKITGGNANFDGTHGGSGTLILVSGNVTGNGNVTVGGFDWTGGNVEAKVTTTGDTTISGAAAKTLSSELTLAGNTTWNGNQITTTSAARIKNDSGKTFTANDSGILSGGGTFTNDGAFSKSAGTTDIQTKFDNTGSIDVSGGRLKLTGGGASSGNLTVGINGTLEIASTNYTFTSGTLGGTGTIEVTNATTAFGNTSGSVNLKVSGGTAKFDGVHTGTGKLSLLAGNVAGVGDATISTFDWTGGSLNAKVTSAGTTISGTSPKTLGAGGNLTLTNNTTWSGDTISTNSSAKIRNDTGGIFVAGNGLVSSDGTTTFTNAGTFKKTGAAGETHIQAAFESSGSLILDDNTGTLKLSGGGRSTGNVTVGTGATVRTTSSYTFENSAFSGGGAIDVNGGTTTFKGTTGSANLMVTGGTAHIDTSHQTTGKLSLSSGGLTGGGTATVGNFEWTGGSLNAQVTSAGTTIGGNGPKTLGAGGNLTLTGNTTWTGDTISTSGSAKIRNDIGGTFVATNGLVSSDGTTTFTNAGTFKKTGAAGETHIQAAFESSGSLILDDNTGTLKLSGGGRSTGNVLVGNGANVRTMNSYTFEGGALSGGGTIEVNGGTTTFKGTTGNANVAITGGSANIDTSHSTSGKLSLSLGSITGNGTATVGNLEWSGGDLNAKVVSNSATLSGGTKSLLTAAELAFNGTTTWDGSTINASGAARMRNENGASFLVNGDGILANSGSGVFTNNGTFTKTTSSGGSTQIQTRFENNGTVNVNSGKLVLQGGGNNSGSILVASAATLEIAGNLDLSTNSTLSGNGVGRLLGGTLSANGSVAIRNFSFEGGSLGGSHTFTGAVDWSGGDWNSAGTTTIIGTLDLHGSNHDFNRRSILNQGTVNWHGGNLRGGNGSVFTNNSVFNDLNAGNSSFSTQDGAASFTNNGEYRKTSSGTTTIEVPFTNNGGMKIAAGSLVFASTFTNNGGIHLTNGATAQFGAPLSFGVNSALSGVGTVNAPSVTAAGHVSPGVSPGMLVITGNLTLLSTSTLLIELGGPAQGIGYDFLNVGGAGTLAGNLQVSFVNGYQWSVQPTDTFTILTANAGLTGSTFGNAPLNGQRISTFDGAATFRVNYGLNSVTLSEFVVAVPEPSTWAMLGVGGVLVLLSLRRRK